MNEDWSNRIAARIGRAVREFPDVYPFADEALIELEDGTRKKRLVCQCDGRTHVIATVHRDLSEGGALLLWTAGTRGAKGAEPPVGLHLPDSPADGLAPRFASCPRCRNTVLLVQLPGYARVVGNLGAPSRGVVAEG